MIPDLQSQVIRLRTALADLVGASSPEELDKMAEAIRALLPEGTDERTTILNAIRTLREIP